MDFPEGALRRDPILRAVLQKDKNALLEVLKKRRRKPLPLPIHYGKQTALHVAASQPEYKECLDLLLHYNNHSILIDIDAQNIEGQTALHIALVNGCEETVVALLQKGCNPDKKSQGETVFEIAAAGGYSNMVRHLLNYTTNFDTQDLRMKALSRSVLFDHKDITEMLLEKGVDSAQLDSLLYYACVSCSIDHIRLILRNNFAALNRFNGRDVTPFMVALQNSKLNAEDLEYLIRNGAKTDICGKFEGLPLFWVPNDCFKLFPVLLQSTDISCIERYCSSFFKVVSRSTHRLTTFKSLTCSTLDKRPEFLSALINSHVPKSILQMPDLLYSSNLRVYSPLAHLFASYFQHEIDTELFEQKLHMLLEHKIVMMDEFRKAFKINWPYPKVRFVHPFSSLIREDWYCCNVEYYFNLLIEHGVTTDYCLQCYHDNTYPFSNYVNYDVYHMPVKDAVTKGNVELVKLLITNSAIVEPDLLCDYFIQAYNSAGFPKNPQKARDMCQYLRSLKPAYYKPMQSNVFNLPSHRILTASEEFCATTLQQLCRTAIRQCVREPTLEGNLQNFHRKILELPLPQQLKDYLLFKS